MFCKNGDDIIFEPRLSRIGSNRSVNIAATDVPRLPLGTLLRRFLPFLFVHFLVTFSLANYLSLSHTHAFCFSFLQLCVLFSILFPSALSTQSVPQFVIFSLSLSLTLTHLSILSLPSKKLSPSPSHKGALEEATSGSLPRPLASTDKIERNRRIYSN